MNENDLLERYLSRLQLAAPPPPTERGLRDLHLAHLVHVPFENLDIPPASRCAPGCSLMEAASPSPARPWS
ncbi:hypothetical protein [Sorangium sp. So ce233]|uniref:hypothetical protein n=1 Tax=Sorangium sp. So ce233 TaxID=3133290 RepID=UPI003F60DF13